MPSLVGSEMCIRDRCSGALSCCRIEHCLIGIKTGSFSENIFMIVAAFIVEFLGIIHKPPRPVAAIQPQTMTVGDCLTFGTVYRKLKRIPGSFEHVRCNLHTDELKFHR